MKEHEIVLFGAKNEKYTPPPVEKEIGGQISLSTDLLKLDRTCIHAMIASEQIYRATIGNKFSSMRAKNIRVKRIAIFDNITPETETVYNVHTDQLFTASEAKEKGIFYNCLPVKFSENNTDIDQMADFIRSILSAKTFVCPIYDIGDGYGSRREHCFVTSLSREYSWIEIIPKNKEFSGRSHNSGIFRLTDISASDKNNDTRFTIYANIEEIDNDKDWPTPDLAAIKNMMTNAEDAGYPNFYRYRYIREGISFIEAAFNERRRDMPVSICAIESVSNVSQANTSYVQMITSMKLNSDDTVCLPAIFDLMNASTDDKYMRNSDKWLSFTGIDTLQFNTFHSDIPFIENLENVVSNYFKKSVSFGLDKTHKSVQIGEETMSYAKGRDYILEVINQILLPNSTMNTKASKAVIGPIKSFIKEGKILVRQIIGTNQIILTLEDGASVLGKVPLSVIYFIICHNFAVEHGNSKTVKPLLDILPDEVTQEFKEAFPEFAKNVFNEKRARLWGGSSPILVATEYLEAIGPIIVNYIATHLQ